MIDKYGLIGYPLGHSFSKKYFTEKFEKEGIAALYSLFPIEKINLLPSLISQQDNLKGLNVTIPYKECVIDYLDEISEEVKQIGACNVIHFSKKEDKIHLKGYNSDYFGFAESLKPLLRSDIKKALVLGTGGAAKAVVYALNILGVRPVMVSRTPRENMLSYSMLNEDIFREYLLIINTTPLGMFPHTTTFPPIPYNLITPLHICYDLVYNPENTEFMKKAKENGAIVKNGLEMLHLQALRAWEIWSE